MIGSLFWSNRVSFTPHDRGDGVKGTQDIFYRKIKSLKEGLPPIFNVDGVNFIFIKRNGLYFVCTTKFNISPAFAVEVLTRISDLCKDYCGVLNEESIKKNFPLIYELLDEMLVRIIVHFHCTHQVASTGSKSEIFVDLLERLTVLIGSNGNILRSDIDGCIQMKIFMAGNPEIRIGLNEDFFVGKSDMLTQDSVAVRLDNCTFHESVDLSNFEATRTLVVKPPQGEFVAMKYRLSETVHSNLPFTLIAFVNEEDNSKTLEVVLKLKCTVPSSSCANNIVMKLPLPKSADNVSHRITSGTQTAEYKSSEKAWYWTIAKLQGGREVSATVKIYMNEIRKSARKEIGPVSLEFEIPMHICSGLQIRHLRVQDRGKTGFSPFRWVRYITHSDSYVIRI
ncbi:PREDICTED: AP-4 complex subunit mu-like [Acropora digitifera]|uniref:AP-4 complex subunit mu-like n=1 Tax=Acropora digitifera TaxID=70779 RepID=UPI00077A39DA|nr:PREDICTED: AP-4 complex subunit mu-like [Acropora digitifera]